MTKKRFEKKNYKQQEDAAYECKKCARQARKEKQVCNPKSIGQELK